MREFFSRLLRLKQSQAQASLAVHYLGREVPADKDYESFSRETYQKLAVAYSSVRQISTAVCSIPLVLYAKKGDVIDEVPDHPILDLLNKPNPLQGREAFLDYVVGYLMLSGNSYVHAVSVRGEVRELWPLRPDRMRVEAGRLGLPSKYIHKVANRETSFPVSPGGKSEILHVKLFNPTNDWYGQSPMQAAALSVDQANEAGLWNLSLLRNAAQPTGAFVVNQKSDGSASLTDSQLDSLRAQIRDRYEGPRNARRPLILSGGVDWKELSLSPRDMDFLNSKKTNEKDVALAFGVPGQLVGVEGSQTFANYEQARMAFYMETVIPVTSFLLSYLNRWLVPAYGEELYLGFDQDRIQALGPLRDKEWEKVERSSFLTINEKREALGYGPYEPGEAPGDKILVSSALIPIDVASEGFGDPQSDPDENDLGDLADEDPDFGEEEDEKAAKVELKMLNLRSTAAKRRLWLAQDRKRRAFERALKSRLKGAFSKQAKEVAEALDGLTDPKLAEMVLEGVLQKTQSDFDTALLGTLGQTMQSFGKDVLNSAKSTNPAEAKDSRDRFEHQVQRFLSSEIATVVSRVSRTTRKRVMRGLEKARTDAVELESSAPDLKSAVLKVYADFSDSRADLVSRTEVHKAATEASRAAAQELRIPTMQKEWIAALDARTRDGHRDINGTRVPLDEKFDVPGPNGVSSMEGPGDPTAPVEQLVNCRCTLVYLTPENGEGS